MSDIGCYVDNECCPFFFPNEVCMRQVLPDSDHFMMRIGRLFDLNLLHFDSSWGIFVPVRYSRFCAM